MGRSPNKEDERRFDAEFKSLCVRHGVDAAYYIPRWSDDGLTGFASGGARGACELLDTLMPLGVQAAIKKEGSDAG